MDPEEKEFQWMRALYEEAWRQYDHEDNLLLGRTQIYLLVQGAAISVMIAAAPFLVTRTISWAGRPVAAWGLAAFAFILFWTSVVLRKLTYF